MSWWRPVVSTMCAIWGYSSDTKLSPRSIVACAYMVVEVRVHGCVVVPSYSCASDGGVGLQCRDCIASTASRATC